MVEEPGHGDTLLETDGEDVAPFLLRVPAARAVDNVRDVDFGEPVGQGGVGDALGAHVAEGVRVDDLLAEGAAGEVRPLWDVEDVRVGGFADGAAVYGPKAAEDAEEGGFAAAVGADDEEVVGWFDGEVQFLY